MRSAVHNYVLHIIVSTDLLHVLLSPVQVKGELTRVEESHMQSSALEDSFARVGYSVEAEQAVNEQIK